MNYGLAFVGIIPIVATGGLLYWNIRSRYGFSEDLSSQIPLAFAFGIGAMTLAVFYLSLVSTSTAIKATILLFILMSIGYLLWVLIRYFRSEPELANPSSLLVSVLVGTVLLVVLWFMASRAGPGHDSYLHWGMKAKAGFIEGGWNFSKESLERFSHPPYPLTIPTLQAWIYTAIGMVDEDASKIVFILFYFMLGLLFFDATKEVYTTPIASFFTVLMLATPLLAITALSAYADVPLTFFLFGSVLYLLRWIETKQSRHVVVGSILASLMLLIKEEAIVYWIFILLFIAGTILSNLKSDQVRIGVVGFSVYLLAGILIAGSWITLINILGVSGGSFDAPSLSLLMDRSNRLFVIAGQYMRELFLDFSAWGILWYLIVVAVFIRGRKVFQLPQLFLLLSIVVPLTVLSISFTFSTWQDYTAHMDVALSRLILHTVPIAWLFIARQSEGLQSWFETMIERTVK